MSPEDTVLLKALAAPGLCLLAGVVNTLFALKLARNEKQRSLLVRFNLVFWSSFSLLEVLPLSLSHSDIIPSWAILPPTVVFFAVFFISIGWMRRRLFAMRVLELSEEKIKEKLEAKKAGKTRGGNGKSRTSGGVNA